MKNGDFIERDYLSRWKKELDERPDLLFDVECFSSIEYLEELDKLLSTLKDISVKIRLVIPSALLNALKDLSNGQTSAEIENIFSAWLIYQFSEEQIRYIINGLASDSKYKDQLKRTLDTFSFVSAEDIIL